MGLNNKFNIIEKGEINNQYISSKLLASLLIILENLEI